MTVKKTSHAGKGLYKVYRDQLIFGKNKIKKLKRHLKKFPDDAVAQKALKEHSSGIHASPRWGHKDGSNLSAGRRLSEQLESNAKAAWKKDNTVILSKESFDKVQELTEDSPAPSDDLRKLMNSKPRYQKF